MTYHHLRLIWSVILTLALALVALSWYAIVSQAWPPNAWPVALAYGLIAVWIFRVGRSANAPPGARRDEIARTVMDSPAKKVNSSNSNDG